MVGWIPPVLKDRAERLQEFSQRLKACHDVGPNDTAFILHYDSGVGDMRPYFWCAMASVPFIWVSCLSRAQAK